MPHNFWCYVHNEDKFCSCDRCKWFWRVFFFKLATFLLFIFERNFPQTSDHIPQSIVEKSCPRLKKNHLPTLEFWIWTKSTWVLIIGLNFWNKILLSIMIKVVFSYLITKYVSKGKIKTTLSYVGPYQANAAIFWIVPNFHGREPNMAIFRDPVLLLHSIYTQLCSVSKTTIFFWIPYIFSRL